MAGNYHTSYSPDGAGTHTYIENGEESAWVKKSDISKIDFWSFFDNLSMDISDNDFFLTLTIGYGNAWVVGNYAQTGARSSFGGLNDLNFQDYIVATVTGKASNGGDQNWTSTAIEHSIKTAAGTGLLTNVREVAEWEYVRQARFNRSISGNYNQPIKHSLRGLKSTGRVLGGAGIVLTGVDMGINGVNMSNGLDLVMGGVAFIPVFGWAVSGTYFIANTATELISGQSIGDHIQGSFTDPNATWKPW